LVVSKKCCIFVIGKENNIKTQSTMKVYEIIKHVINDGYINVTTELFTQRADCINKFCEESTAALNEYKEKYGEYAVLDVHDQDDDEEINEDEFRVAYDLNLDEKEPSFTGWVINEPQELDVRIWVAVHEI